MTARPTPVRPWPAAASGAGGQRAWQPARQPPRTQPRQPCPQSLLCCSWSLQCPPPGVLGTRCAAAGGAVAEGTRVGIIRPDGHRTRLAAAGHGLAVGPESGCSHRCSRSGLGGPSSGRSLGRGCGNARIDSSGSQCCSSIISYRNCLHGLRNSGCHGPCSCRYGGGKCRSENAQVDNSRHIPFHRESS